jgi:hypothetical protein
MMKKISTLFTKIMATGMLSSVTMLGLAANAIAQSNVNNPGNQPDTTAYFNQISSGFKNVPWGAAGNTIGPKVYIADFSNMIYKQTHVSQECYAKGDEIKEFSSQKNSAVASNLNIYCFKNDKLVTGITLSPGKEQKTDSEALLSTMAKSTVSQIPQKQDGNVSYSTWKLNTAKGNIFMTQSYDSQHNLSLSIVFNDALLRMYANDEEKKILASNPNASMK